jgi:hypothetical protein
VITSILFIASSTLHSNPITQEQQVRSVPNLSTYLKNIDDRSFRL